MRFLFLLLFLWTTAAAAADSLRVSPQWLNDRLPAKSHVIIDARPAEEYRLGHIQGALSLPEVLTYQHKATSGRIVEPDVMQKLLQERGIDQYSKVIVYDAGNLLDASRLFWVLEVYGLNHVQLLSPGYDYWVMQSFATSMDPPIVTPSKYVATINYRRIASKFSTQLAIADSGQFIIDARAPAAYRGETSTAERHGHIPKAVNIPIASNLDQDNGITALRSTAELASAYSLIPREKKVVLYCEMGRASSVTYLALRELGYDVANYDASWHEWGNDLNLPIEK